MTWAVTLLVPLELVLTLSVTSLIRRFRPRKGAPRLFFSDNAESFKTK